MDEGGELAANMSRFYSMLRSQMLKAQINRMAGFSGSLSSYSSPSAKPGQS